jgi:hypothetical protein
VQDFLEGVSPIKSMHLGGVSLEGISKLFKQYIDILIMAIPDPGGDPKLQRVSNLRFWLMHQRLEMSSCHNRLLSWHKVLEQHCSQSGIKVLSTILGQTSPTYWIKCG